MSAAPESSHVSKAGARTLRLRPIIAGLVALLVAWVVVAYLVLPDWWKGFEKRHPALSDAPTLTATSSGIPGDPLNVFVIATQEQLTQGLVKAGWYPADRITLESSIRIAEDSALHRSYDEAPVSALFLFGRKQDLAFEKPVGKDPRERHHVRFWKASEVDDEGMPAWWGAATYDRSVGFSHTTGEVTHHISPDVDAERNLILDDLQAQGAAGISFQDAFQKAGGRNGGGDPWRSDGRLGMAEFDPAR